MTSLESEARDFLGRDPDENIPQFLFFTMEENSCEHSPQDIVPFGRKLDEVVRIVSGLSVLQQFILPTGGRQS